MSPKKAPDFTEPASLLACVQKLLTQHRKNVGTMTYFDIAKATGLGMHWIESVATGRIKEPSVNRVQCLYEHLTGTKLTLGA